MNKQKKIGSILSYILIIIKLATTFFYIPFVLTSIGKDNYGLFSIVGALMAYITILDLGVNDSTLRYFVKFRLEKNKESKKHILGSVSNVYKYIALFVITGSLFFFFLIDPLYQQTFSESQMVVFKKMFIISSISVFFTLLFNPLGSILNAYERFKFLKLTEIASFLLTTLTIVFFLYNGYGVLYIVIISAIFNLLNIFSKLYYVRNILKIKYPNFEKTKKYQREIILYGLPIFVAVIVQQIYWKLDNIIIGSILGPAMVTLYAMGVVFQKYILSFSTAISRIMSPGLIKNIDLNQSMSGLTETYIKTSRLQLFVVLFIMLNLIISGDVFFELWLGKEYNISHNILLLVMIPFSIEIIGNLRNTFLQVYGYYWYRAIIILIISVINIFATIILLDYYGIVGAAFSTSISLLLGYVVTNYLMFIKIKMNLFPFFKQVWFRSFSTILIVISSGFLIKSFFVIDDWIRLFLFNLLISLIYFISVFVFYLQKQEKKQLLNVYKIRILRKR